MTATVAPPKARRRGWLWVVLGLVGIVAVATLSTYFTATRPGGRLDAEATGPDGAHALVTLLRDHGVEVVVARQVADVEREARADSLLLIANTEQVTDDELLRRLSDTPGDLLLVQPTSVALAGLVSPDLIEGGADGAGLQPDCAMHEAERAGRVDLQITATYRGSIEPALTSCYDGALIRYHTGLRMTTVVGSTYFLSNQGLLKEGNAALAMNLAGARARVVWYAPQHAEGSGAAVTSFTDLIPDNVTWLIWQLSLAVLLLALWQGRRLGPLVAEHLPVVVRASETVEGRGRLYRSRRSRDRAADALRTATLQRLLPRLGLSANAPPPTVIAAVAQRAGAEPQALGYTLFGPPPATDADLVALAETLDDIERQVTGS